MKDRIINYLTPEYPWRKYFAFFNEIDSTNTRLKIMASQGAPHGTILAADCQTGGRGRLGRSFLSPSGVGMYMSILLRPECRPQQLMHLTCAVGSAMCDAIEKAAGIRPKIKWTNDLVFGKKKLGGILTELGIRPDGTVDYAVVGIGINCCQKADDFPPELRAKAASLEMITGKKIDRAVVAAAMMEALWQMDDVLLTDKNTILGRYRQDCMTLGQHVSIVRGDEIRYAEALDIGEDGDLIVRYDSGEIGTVSSGEVSVRGMYGYV